MKTTCFFPAFAKILFVLLVAASLTSCKNTDPDNIFGGTGTITITLDGKTYDFDVRECVFLDGTLNMGNVLEDNAFFQIHTNDEGMHTLNLGGGQGLIDQLNFTLPDGTQYFATEGSVQVEKLNNSKSNGTIQAKVTDDIFNPAMTYDITGTFEANY